MLLAGYTFGGLSTPGNGSSYGVLPIVQCHSTLACAGGDTSFQCLQGYADTRCSHEPTASIPSGSFESDLYRPLQSSFETHCPEGSVAGVAHATSATMACRDDVTSAARNGPCSSFPASSQLLQSWQPQPSSSTAVNPFSRRRIASRFGCHRIRSVQLPSWCGCIACSSCGQPNSCHDPVS